MAERDDPEIQADRVSRTACPQCSHVVDVSGAEPFSVIECPQCRTRFAAPGRLGQFVLLKLLGKGEMGATYKALDGTLHRYVAVKVMRKALGEDRGRVDGFLAEGRALASLDHPNAVRIYSLGEEKGQPFIVMELVTGSSMDRLFSADEPMDEARALEIALGVAEALHAAREIGLVHGDVKPGNIMLDEKGRAKLVDFGIARFGGGRAGSGEALGTPYYIAPEQVRGRPVDHRADIYSLGASLFHALAARPPFPGSSVKEVLQARLDSPAPDLLKVRPSLHRRTGDVVARMLATEPADRYGDYPELLADLREACRQVTEPEAAGAVETAAEEAIPLAVPVSPGISRLVWAVGGAVAVVAAVIVSWVLLAGVIGTTSGPAQQVADPVFSPPARSIAAATDVAVRCETPGARVHYTTDGSEPDELSRVVSGPVRVQPGATLRARAFCEGFRPSRTAQAVYTRDTGILADVIPVRTAARKAWETVRFLDREQGFGKLLDQGDALAANAEEFYRQAAYGASKTAFQKLRALCEKIQQRQEVRERLLAARDRAETARRGLLAAGGRKDSASPWAKAGRSAEQAQEAFVRGDFAKAELHWKAAAGEATAELALRASEARKAWQKALDGADAERLRAHGGGAWRQAERAAADAQRAEQAQDPLEAVQQYRRALSALAAAKKAAASGWIEAEKTRLVNEARKLADKGEYHAALAKANAALKLKPSSGSARKLKRELQGKLKLTLDLGSNQKMELVWVPAGRFVMGSPGSEEGRGSTEWQHEVVLRRPFYIGRTEVTRSQFRAFAKDRKTIAELVGSAYTIYRGKWGLLKDAHWRKCGFEQKDDHPVVCVSWLDAHEFCKWLGKKAHRTVRLPTEAEWEYACRAGAKTAFHFGDKADDLTAYANYADESCGLLHRDKDHKDGWERTAPVGKFKVNAWGLRDMHGNVREWCEDSPREYPRGGPVTDPRGLAKSKLRAIRGGSWRSLPKDCRSADRFPRSLEYRASDVGFRVVVETPQQGP